jgi:acyl-CoA thioesterase FadM
MLPQLLFQPIITSSRAPLMEIDYNMHKSNSTYFSDLDISRVHLIACLMKLGLHRGREAIVAEKDGAFGIMLGAVTCSFKREIKPYEAYEIWTQVLAWDQKWLYLQSHIVRPGHRPKAWTLQPWRKDVAGEKQRERFKEKPAYDGVIASSVAKYVFKQGRKTIAPERMFELSGMLPEGRGHVWQSAEGPMPYNAQIAMSEPEMWDAERFEQERLHGLRTAERVDDLAKLNYGHNPGARPALGRY